MKVKCENISIFDNKIYGSVTGFVCEFLLYYVKYITNKNNKRQVNKKLLLKRVILEEKIKDVGKAFPREKKI